MGVHRITSEAARYYAAREKVLGLGISLLGSASEKVATLSKDELKEFGDLAAALLPHAPGYAGKLIAVVARLFWAMAGSKGEFKLVELEELEKWIEEAKKKIGE